MLESKILSGDLPRKGSAEPSLICTRRVSKEVSRVGWIRVQGLPFTSCVTLGQFFIWASAALSVK